MRKKMTVYLLAAMLGTAFIAGGCGADSAKTDTESSEMSMMDGAAAQDAVVDSKSGVTDDEAQEDGGAALEGEAAGAKDKSEQKLIYTYHYSVETKQFDTFMQTLTDKVETLGGYIERSETNGAAEGGTRYASLTLRIPAAKMDDVLSLVQKDANVTHASVSSEDITLRYVDMESHIKALRIEQEALLQLLAQAKKVEDIISLQSQLTEVRYELESYESQLRTYDNLVDYSTMYLDINEVMRTTNMVDAKTSFWEEVRTRFGDNLYGVGQGLRAFAVWLIGSLPVLVILAVLAAAAYFLLRKITKNRRRKIKAGTSGSIDGAQGQQQKQDAETEDSGSKKE